MEYSDKVVIVTGGSKGIGEGCVRVFVEAGSRVVFCARRREAGEALAREVTAKGPGEAHFVACDVSKVEDIRRLLDLNLVSIIAACQLALPHLRKTKGNIINLSSLVGRMGQLHATTYVATKGAVTAFTKALAIDEAAHDVRVNSVSPGNIYTPLWQEAIDAAPDPARCRADGEAAQVLGRMGTIEETGRLCLFLAAEATFTTGVDHVQSGGAELGYGRKTRH